MQKVVETAFSSTRSKRFALRWGAIATIVIVSGLAAACAKEGTAKDKAEAATASSASDLPDVLATVGNENITLADINSRAGTELERIETQYKLLRSKIIEATLDTLLRDKTLGAEAAKSGKSLDELVTAEAGIGINPTDAEIAAWYAANTDRTGGRPLEQVKPQIAELLKNERMTEAATRLEARINKERNVKVNYRPFRLTFDNGKSPSIGKEDAPVTLVEFSDFQCPFCDRFAPTLKQVEKKYGDKVRIVYRQYPIPSIHPFAFKAAEASLCAHEQGKFWEMHDAMFADQSKLGVADLKSRAVSLGLDKKKFDTCLDTGRYVEQVQKDMSDGTKVGITGTPAVFVNGVELKGGAVPLSTVTAAIDKELARIAASN